jgi:hypothetical protein
MPQAANGGQRYQVHISGAIAKKLKQLQRRASLQGRGESVLKALREIVERLREDPLGWGDRLYRLPALRLQVCHGSIRPLFVNFAVSEDKSLVFIKGVELLSEPAE